jgi:hypothetical protein
LPLRLTILVAALAFALSAQSPWLLANFSDRLELEVVNPTSAAVDTLATVPVAEAARIALRFPGTLAIAVMPGPPTVILPTQADDLDGDGLPDEFVFPVRLARRETRTVHIYFSTTLHDNLPWPKRVHASHAFGYNRATVALESEAIGYRTYGGFFLDIQARLAGKPGLHNSLVGYFGSREASPAGIDIIHLGDTLGLGGLFLRAGADTFRPPLNLPDYAHKPAPAEAPAYRVIADGPVRALVEARMDRWTIGPDAVRIRAFYAIAAGTEHVECRFEISPLSLTRTYEIGAGLRHLPKLQLAHAPGRLSLSGEQNAKTGPLAMALYYDPEAAALAPPLVTKDDRNECVVFRTQLAPGRAATGRYALAAAWSGTGIRDLIPHLAALDPQARAAVTIQNLRHARTPTPQRLEGEAY